MRFWNLTKIILLCLISGIAKADIYAAGEIDFQITPFSRTLTQQTVSQTFQDSRGILWFVTQEGLNRYNGYELENYRYTSSDPDSLSSDRVTGITEDHDGTLWISTLGGGLNKYNQINNSFSAIYSSIEQTNSPITNDIYSIFTSNDGQIWLGHNGGISVYTPRENRFFHYASDQNGVPNLGVVNHFAQSSDGKIWAATSSNGFAEIDHLSGTVSLHKASPGTTGSLPSNSVYRLLADSEGKIWLVTSDAGVAVYDPLKDNFVSHRHDSSSASSLSSDRAYYVYEDGNKQVWIGTHDGLNFFHRESGTFRRYTQESNGLPSNRVYSVFQSREGKYWVGTFFGLVAGTSAIFQKIDSDYAQLSSDSVNAFAETSDGSLWVATDDGLNRLRPDAEVFEWINESTSPSISNPTVMSLLADGDKLWVGTYSGGLNQIDLNSNSTKIYKHRKTDQKSIGANGITSLIRTSSGDLIVGTFGGGVSIYQEETDDFVTLRHIGTDPTSLSSNNVIALYQDSLEMIWVGTENGLNHFDPRSLKFERFYSDPQNEGSISSDMVWAFYEDEKQTLWLGTRGGGLNSWDIESRTLSKADFKNHSKTIDLPSSNIYGIQEGKDGNLWLSHNRGITKLSPKTLRSHQYGVRDGLQDNEFNMGASYRAKDGTIYFGGNRGYNIVASQDLRDTSLPPKVSISEVRIMNQRMEFEQPYHRLDNIVLRHEDKMLSVDFFAADYSNVDLNRYAYKLDGLNTEWVISEDSRTASFTTLPPGNYVLRLAAANPDGIWNWDGMALPITVKPPIWLAPIAYFFYAALSILLLIFILSRQKKKALASLLRQRELENMVEERTIDLEESRLIAESANRAKSDFLATMSHEIRTPMHGMIGMTELLLHTPLSDQQKKFAQSAHSSGKALLSLMNDILDFSKIEASKVELEEVEFSLIDLVDEICYLQSEPAQRSNLALNSIIESSLPDWLIGDPTKIRQVIMNLVSNSIKFTHSGEVNIRVFSKTSRPDESQEIIYIAVEDTGIGMDEDTQSRVFEAFTQADTSTTREYGGTGLGLAISSQYIDMMGGDISIKSEQGKGTNITIKIPLKKSQIIDQVNDYNFSDITARIFCKNASTSEMVSCRLDRLGINSYTHANIDEVLDALVDESLVIADYANEHDLSRLESHLASTGAKGILLTDLKSESLKHSNRLWEVLTKPTTSNDLEHAIAKTQGAVDLHSAGDIRNSVESSNDKLSINILVAEDVETNQKIAREMIELLGCTVDIAENGQVAVDLFQKNSYDLIFMDCQMPVVDGYRATEQIRSIENLADIRRTPIVALTAGITKEDQDRYRSSGMDDYLTKPYSLSDLSAILEQHIERSNFDHRDTSRYNSQDTLREAGNPAKAETLNYSALDNIREVERQTGNEILQTLFDGFISQMTEKFSELDSSYENKDATSLYKTAHAIKSMSANIGAEKVRTLSSELEALGRDSEIANTGELIEDLKQAYDEFLSIFKSEILEAC